MGLKQRLLTAAALRTKKVRIEGDEVIVRETTVAESQEYTRLLREKHPDAAAYIIGQCVVDENGDRLLNDEEAVVVARSTRIFNVLMEAIMDVSGIDMEGEGEETEKESDAG